MIKNYQNLANSRLAIILKALCAFSGLLILSTVTAQSAPEVNLLNNSSFEDGGSGWVSCGGVTISDVDTHEGAQALRFGNPTIKDDCGDDLFVPDQVAVQLVNIPANAQSLTISFWYARRGNYFDDTDFSFSEPGEIEIGLTSDPYRFSGFPIHIKTDSITLYDQRGWHLYRQTLNASEIEELTSGIADGSDVYFYIRMYGNLTDEVLATGDKLAYYIDEVRLEEGVVTTTESPMPPALAEITDRPIILTSYDLNHPSPVNNNKFAVFRMNPNGSAKSLIYPGRLANPIFPVWSNSGDRIVAADASVSNPQDIYTSGLISIVSAFDSNGANVQELFRTIGGGGNTSPALPPEQVTPNLDSRITGLAWSPNDDKIAATVCYRSNWGFEISDETCQVELRDVATGETESTIDSGFRVNWGRDNRLLFGATAFGSLTPGIYEIDLNKGDLDEKTLLIRNWGNEIPFHEDGSPAWSSDGKRFALVRDVPGNYYDQNGSLRGQKAIIVYDRATVLTEPDQPDFLLLADHGDLLGSLVWSPDNKFILYTLFQNGEITTADVWWLEVDTGLTGRLTTDGASLGASWRLAEGDIVIPPVALNEKFFLPLTTK